MIDDKFKIGDWVKYKSIPIIFKIDGFYEDGDIYGNNNPKTVGCWANIDEVVKSSYTKYILNELRYYIKRFFFKNFTQRIYRLKIKLNYYDTN